MIQGMNDATLGSSTGKHTLGQIYIPSFDSAKYQIKLAKTCVRKFSAEFSLNGMRGAASEYSEDVALIWLRWRNGD